MGFTKPNPRPCNLSSHHTGHMMINKKLVLECLFQISNLWTNLCIWDSAFVAGRRRRRTRPRPPQTGYSYRPWWRGQRSTTLQRSFSVREGGRFEGSFGFQITLLICSSSVIFLPTRQIQNNFSGNKCSRRSTEAIHKTSHCISFREQRKLTPAFMVILILSYSRNYVSTIAMRPK